MDEVGAWQDADEICKGGGICMSSNIMNLPPMRREDSGKKTLVLDLDETLVHSSFKPTRHYDFIINVEIEGRMTTVYVLKRPYVDRFLQAVSRKFEVVVFTASLRKYADPLLDILDQNGFIKHRLYRNSCRPMQGGFVKDLSRLGRSLGKTIIVDNNPHSYMLQPANAIPISTYLDNPRDRELLDLLDYLESIDGYENVTVALGARRSIWLSVACVAAALSELFFVASYIGFVVAPRIGK